MNASTGIADTSSRHRERAEPLPHLPALDGVRGLAVIGVLLFHGGFTWAKGGFLGVSTFFTLSGFLITNLLVREWENSGSLDLARFWGRRLRRLLPAALAAIALIGILWWRIGTPEQLGTLRGDMLSSLGYVANWHLWSTGVSYGSLFSAPTPFQHFWSLAIEEQFYLFFPVVVVLLMRLGGRRLLIGASVLATSLSLALMWFLRSDFDRVYYGTDTRVAELLFGVVLALWWSSRSRNSTEPTKREPAFDLLGGLALLGIATAWFTVQEASPQLTKGGFPLYAALSTLLIYTATRSGSLSKLLSVPFLRWAGFISYGLYLYHWPIFTYVSEDRTGLPLVPLFIVRMTLTIAVATASYFLLEMPIRRRTLLRTTKAAATAAIAGMGTVALVALALTIDPPASAVPYATMSTDSSAMQIETLHPSATPSNGGRPATFWVIGDSAAIDESPALSSMSEAMGATTFVSTARPGFGLTTGIDWRSDWKKVTEESNPTVAVMMFGSWDLPYIRANGEDAYEAVVDDAVTLLTDRGIRVMLLPVMPGGRIDVSSVDRVFANVAAKHPGLVDNPSILAAFTAPDGSTPRYWIDSNGVLHLLRKKDAWHLCQEGAANLAMIIGSRTTELGWSSPVVSEWTSGAWRDAWQYDDPPGVCDGIG